MWSSTGSFEITSLILSRPVGEQQLFRKLLPNILIAIMSLIVTYTILEVVYRLYRYRELISEYHEYSFETVESPLVLFDENIGYRYKPNSELRWRRFDANNDPQLSNRVSVNNLGHISPTDDSVSKPRGEFRIAILGDSFTASVTNDIPWPSILEERLNDDDHLKDFLGASEIKVINFGMAGTGITQWVNVYDYEVSRFNPDFVIVNFITRDILRKFKYFSTVKPVSATDDYQITLICNSPPATIENKECSLGRVIILDSDTLEDKDALSRIKREIYDERIGQLQWVSPYPELLSRTLGKQLGLQTSLNLNSRFLHRYDNEDKAIKDSIDALRAITSKHAQVLILHNPVYEEIISNDAFPSLLTRLMWEAQALEIVPMVNFLPNRPITNFFPDRYRNQDIDIERLFIPNDGHFSNYGAETYAQLAYLVVKEYLLYGEDQVAGFPAPQSNETLRSGDEDIIWGSGWYIQGKLYNRSARLMGQTGTLLIDEPKPTMTRLSISAFSLMSHEVKVTMIVNGVPIEVFQLEPTSGVPDTHFTYTFPLVSGSNEVEFEVQPVGGPSPQWDPRLYLGVYNITQLATLGVADVMPTHQKQINLADKIEFIGYDQNTDTVHAGDTLHLTLYWRTLEQMDDSYKVFIHLLDQQGNKIAQYDTVPRNWQLPTTAWGRGEVILDEYSFTIPPGALFGQYQIWIGMYSSETMQRLNIQMEDNSITSDSILLSNLTILY